MLFHSNHRNRDVHWLLPWAFMQPMEKSGDFSFPKTLKKQKRSSVSTLLKWSPREKSTDRQLQQCLSGIKKSADHIQICIKSSYKDSTSLEACKNACDVGKKVSNCFSNLTNFPTDYLHVTFFSPLLDQGKYKVPGLLWR